MHYVLQLKSAKINKIYCIPGNAGISSIAENVSLDLNNYENLKQFIIQNNIDIVIIGPEKPLADGLADFLEKNGIKVFGPNKIASQLRDQKFLQKFM